MSSNRSRMPCCVCGDPWTLESPDYVSVVLEEPGDGVTQWLGAHAACLRRVFTVQVETGEDAPAQEQSAHPRREARRR